jgi:DNA end-binding protein Ku
MPSKAKYPAPARGTGLTISVGLVNVPVKIAPLIRSTAIGGRRVCSCHQEQVKQANICTVTGGIAEGVETGFEHEGRMVTGVDRADFKSKRDGQLKLTSFVDIGSIDPLYFEKSYVVWPQDENDTVVAAHDLLARLLQKTGKALVGTTVLTTSTRVVAIRWSQATETLVAHVLTYDANVSWNDVGLVKTGLDQRPAPSEAELDLAEQLLGTLSDSDAGEVIGDVTDEYNERLVAAIEAAAQGLPAPVVEDEPEAAPVIDLLAALQASVEAAAPAKTKAKAKPRKKVAA